MASQRESTSFIRSTCARSAPVRRAVALPSRSSSSCAQQLGQLLRRLALGLAGRRRRRVASRLASAICLAQLVVHAAQLLDRGAHVAHRRLDVLGPDLLLGARDRGSTARCATSCASSDWISTFSSEACLSRSPKRSFIVRSCCLTPSSVVGRFESCRSSPSRSIAMLIELSCAPRASATGRGSRGSCRTNFCADVDQLVHRSRPTWCARAARSGKIPTRPVALHGVLDALDQLLAVDADRAASRRRRWPAPSCARRRARPCTHLAAVGGTNDADVELVEALADQRCRSRPDRSAT